jgi:hypothetical protein
METVSSIHDLVVLIALIAIVMAPRVIKPYRGFRQ